jgi:light-regulated signal transduction histidine kinase (bacteriophytochrome)
MTIKDIRFTGYTNLANCESEPIHIPGTIQPYGALLAMHYTTLRINFCSANIKSFIDLEAAEILGKELQEIMGIEECTRIKNHVTESRPEQLYTLKYGTKLLSTSFYHQGDMLLMEIERANDADIPPPDVFLQSRDFVNFLEKNSSLRDLCNYVATEIARITGYDRVMVYRFDNEFNGEVYAESVNKNVKSFLGLHYPHSDIPPQARALFAQNLLRMIPDVYYKPVPVLTAFDNATNESLDMSLGGLRSVSPIHIEYLKNMDVGASLTVSLIHNKKLWGLIACHHNTPKLVPPSIRLATKLQAHFLTSQISNREAVKDYELSLSVNQNLASVLKNIQNHNVDHYINDTQLYECINADGIAIVTKDKIYLGGSTPAKQQIEGLIRWLDTKTEADYFSTMRLAGEYPDALAIKDTASGVIFHSLYKESLQGVIWFRGEKKHVISWAGNPNEKAEKENDLIMPRKSFTLWKQVVANTSAYWKKAEVDGAIRLSTKIQNNIFLAFIIGEEKKYRLQTGQLLKVNEELGNFNHVCSHDLQEPIRKILIFSNMLLHDKKGDKEDVLRKIHNSALRAVKQINDLLRFASISNYSDEITNVNLDKCIETVLKDFELIIAEKNATISYDILGSIQAIPSQIEQLLNNLIGNALKFKGEEKLIISISLRDVSVEEIIQETTLDSQYEYICITIKDNGIGFEQKFAEKIFTIFSRLHDNSKYVGSGIGLAICKKIVSNHNGYIMARSQKGEGASFSIYLKK